MDLHATDCASHDSAVRGPHQSQLADPHSARAFSSKELEITQMPNTWEESRQTRQEETLLSYSGLWLPADVGGKHGPLLKKVHTLLGAGQRLPRVPDRLGAVVRNMSDSLSTRVWCHDSRVRVPGPHQ